MIEILKGYANETDSGDLKQRLGMSFARGHKEAIGGIVPKAEFEELMSVMRVGEKPEETAKDKKSLIVQSNTLMNYFALKE
jgi:hypothetical protein